MIVITELRQCVECGVVNIPLELASQEPVDDLLVLVDGSLKI